MANPIGDLVVKRRASPALRYGLVVAGVVLVVGGGAGLFWRGESVAGFNTVRAAHEERDAHARIARLKERVGKLSTQLAMSKGLLQSNAVAYAALSSSLKQSDEQVMRLKERLGFYQAVLGASKTAKGITIERFRVVEGAKGLRYRLVLVQPFALSQGVYAHVELTVQGEKARHSSKISPPSLVDTSRTVHFKYFDDLRGSLALPAGLTPSGVVVRVAAGGRVVTQRYPWPDSTPSVARK